MKLKILLLVFCVGVMLGSYLVATWWAGKQMDKAFKVHWMGHPMFFDTDGTNGNFHWADDIELGCRADGMVIWRRTAVATNWPARIVHP